MSVAVVILNYNGKELLRKFLPSVIANSKEANIYVADNASSDNSIEFVKSQYPEITIIENEGNFGYAKGYNEALINVKEDIYCLLNSDVEVTENWLAPILSEFESDLNTAIIQPKILDYKNRDHFEYAGASGGFIDKYGFPFCRGRIFDTVENDKGQYNDPIEIMWASGACFFIRRSIFKKMDGFDKKFFAHMEEIDLCWRVFNQGQKIKVIPKSSVYHLGGGTLQYYNPRKTYLNFRNSLFTLVKNVPTNLISTLLKRLILDGVAAMRFLFKFQFTHFFAVIKAHCSFYLNLPHFLNKRNQTENRVKYYKTKSIVWSYFIKGIRVFSSL